MVEELKRYFCIIEHVTESNMVHLSLIDGYDILTRYTAVTTVEKLEEQGLHVHDGKNFHLVIRKDGTWNLYWIKNPVLKNKEEAIKIGVFDELLSYYYQR